MPWVRTEREDMSMRSEVNRKKRALDMLACAGFALFGVGLLSIGSAPFLPVIAIAGFAIFFGAITYSFYGIKCLKCHGPFGYVVVAMGTLFRISKKMRYCPFCGVDLDADGADTSKGT